MASLILISVSLSREVFSHHFFKWDFFPFYLSSVSRTSEMHIIICLMMSQKSLRLHSLFQFCSLDGIILLPYLQVCWYFLLLALVWCWIPLLKFLVQLLGSWLVISVRYLLILSISVENLTFVMLFPWPLWAFLWEVFLTFYCVNHLSPFNYGLTLEFYFIICLKHIPLFLYFSWLSVLVFAH